TRSRRGACVSCRRRRHCPLRQRLGTSGWMWPGLTMMAVLVTRGTRAPSAKRSPSRTPINRRMTGVGGAELRWECAGPLSRERCAFSDDIDVLAPERRALQFLANVVAAYPDFCGNACAIGTI